MSNIDLDFNYNEFGVVECTPAAGTSIEPELKLKVDQLVNNILPKNKNFESIKINHTKDTVHVEIDNVEIDTKDIIQLAKSFFDDTAATRLENVNIKVPKTAPPPPVMPNMKPPPFSLTDKQLAHILAGEFGKGSQLEGHSSLPNLKFLVKFLEDRLTSTGMPYGLSSQVYYDLSNGVRYSIKTDDPTNIYSSIESAINPVNLKMSFGKSLIIDGGWIGAPNGHSIYYELIPQENGKANLRLYNLGAGVGSFDQVIVGSKAKSNPVVEWQGIPYNNLLNPAFSKVLYELSHQKITPEKYNTDYGAKDIYYSLKEMLQPEKEAFIYDSWKPMTEQRGGWCSWKSLMAYMRTKMDEKNYKIMKCDLKLSALVNNYNTKGDGTLSEAARWRLISKSLASVSRDVDKLYEAGFVGQEYVEKAAELLAPIHPWVKANKDVVLKKDALPDIKDLRYTPLNKVPEKSSWDKGKMLKPEQPLAAGQAATGPAMQLKGDLLDKVKAVQGKPIEEMLKQALPLVKKAWLEKRDVESHMALNLIISNLSMHKDDWIKAAGNDPEKAKKLISQLAELQGLYIKTCWTVPKAEIILPERVLNAYKLLYIQSHLAEIIIPDKWELIKPCGFEMLNFLEPSGIFSKLPSIKSIFHFHLFTSKQNEEFLEIARWLSKPSKSPINCSGLSDLHLQSDFLQTALSFEDSGVLFRQKGDEPTLVDQLALIDPSLIKKVSKEVRDFESASKPMRDAFVIMSKQLPTWFDSLLNSYVLASSLAKNSINPPTVINREQDLNLIKTYDYHKIKFQLSGITIPKPQSDRFEQCYPPFKSNKLNVFLQGLMNWKSAENERSLVAEKEMSKYNLTPIEREEFKELAYINLNSHLCIPSTLSFFQRNPSHLIDPDYQIFFEMLMFQPGYLQDALKLEGFEEKLVQFIAEGMDRCLKDNQIQAAVFLARQARYLNQIVPNPAYQDHQLPLLRTLLKIQGLDINLKTAIYSEICANLSSKETLDAKDIEDTLIGSVLIKCNPIPANWTNEYVKQDIASNLRRHAEQLEKALLPNAAPNQQLLNAVLSGYKPEAKETVWQVKQKAGEFPLFFTTEGYEYYPLNGDFVYPGAQIQLPDTITQQATFKKIFPSVKKGVQLPGNVFAFKDPKKGFETRVVIKDDNLVIDQLRGKKHASWHRYIPRETLSFNYSKYHTNLYSPLYSHYLAEGHFNAWQKLDEDPPRIWLVDPATNNKAYDCQFEKKGDGFEIKRIQQYKVPAVLGLSSTLMKMIEEPQYIHEWYKQDKLSQVDLPRYNLSFTVDAVDPSKLNCQQFPGFFLKPGEVLKKAGAYRHYVVLEDSHGNKKALFPVHHFEALEKKEEQEVFEPRYKIDMQTKEEISNPQHYYVYEVMKNGTLFSKSREANLYLAEVSLLVQDCKQAAALLKQYGKKLRAYTPVEIELLQKIARIHEATNNIEGNALGIQMYASYLLEQNLSDFPREEKKQETHLEDNYDLYLDHLNTINILKLTKDEELYVIRNLTRSLASEHRKQELLGLEEATPAIIPANYAQPPFEAAPAPLDFTQMKINEYNPWQYQKEQLKFSNITRMGRTFSSGKVLAIYDLLHKVNDPAKQAEYNAGLIFWKNGLSDQRDLLKANFFTLVLNHKNEFPDIPANLNDEYSKAWWAEVMVIANQVSKQHPPLRPIKSQPKEIEGGPGRIIKHPPIAKIELGPLQLQEIPPLKKEGIVGKPNEAWFTATERKTPAPTQKEKLPEMLEHLIPLTSDQDKKTNPLVESEVNRLKQDLVAYGKQPKTPYYELNGNALENIEKFYTDIVSSTAQDSHKSQMDDLKKQIIVLANQSPLPPFGKARKSLLEWGGKQKPLKLGELIVNFAKQDPTALKERNPALFPDDIKTIYEKIGLYLQLDAQKQQSQRVLKHVNTINELKKQQANVDTIDGVVQLLAGEAAATRSYTMKDNPAFLVFEYCAGIILRPPQVKMLDDFLKNKDVEAIRELIMGSGKSKVLMPLLAFLRADGIHLSTLIVPEALYQSISKDTQEILLETFNIDLHTLDFNRSTEFDVKTLENILAELKSIRDNKESLIITSKSLQCLLLKFIEKAADHFSHPADPKPMTPELTLMREILGMLSTGYSLLDEADLLLNVLHEVSFSLGKRNAPIQQEIDLIGDLYNILYTNPDIKKLARVESDPKGDLNAPLLTDQLYHASVKEPLAEALIEHLKKKEYDDKTQQTKINAFFTNLKGQEKEAALNYLCRTKDKETAAQAFYDQQPKEIREILALAGEEISNLLPHSLLKSCKEKYGVDEEMEGLLSIPFASANTPSRGSEFANHHITMNYTIQNYIQKSIPKKILASHLQLLQDSARREMVENQIPLQNTRAWQLFCVMRGDLNIPFFNITDLQTDLLLKQVNSNATARLRLVQNLILPQIVIFDKKISSNSHNLASLLKICGFTGALWNGPSMHRKLTSVRTEGTDALTLTALWTNSYDAIHLERHMMEQLKSTELQFDMLADAGGYFKDVDNLTNAKLLTKLMNKPVVFYDHNGDQAVWEQTGSTLLAESPYKNKEEERGTFLDQAHTTGADVSQKPRAVSLVTIGAGMLLRDLLQAVWRLRGLDKFQRVEFMISKDVETLMRQTLKKGTSEKLTFADILGFTIINQAKAQGRDNFKGFNAELNEVLQKAFLDVMLNPTSTPQDCAKAVQELGSSWIKTSFASAETLYGQIPVEGNSEKMRKDISESFVEKVNASSLTKGLEKEIGKIAEHYKGRLPPVTSTRAGNEDLTTEQERQKIAEKHAELEVVATTSGKTEDLNLGEIIESDELMQNVPDKFTADLYPEKLRTIPSTTSDDDWIQRTGKYPLPVFPLKLYFDEYAEFKQYADLFEGIDLSLGMLQIPDKKEIATSEIEFFGPHRKPIRYVVIDNGKVTMMNNAETDRRVKKGNKRVYEMTLGYVGSKEKVTPKDVEMLTKVKFLNGESHYTKEEMKVLRDWVTKQGVKKMYDFLNTHALKGQQLKIREYQQSALQNLFQELMLSEPPPIAV